MIKAGIFMGNHMKVGNIGEVTDRNGIVRNPEDFGIIAFAMTVNNIESWMRKGEEIVEGLIRNNGCMGINSDVKRVPYSTVTRLLFDGELFEERVNVGVNVHTIVLCFARDVDRSWWDRNMAMTDIEMQVWNEWLSGSRSR